MSLPGFNPALASVAKHEGLARPEGIRGDEPFVQILDPAVGTGTFLAAVLLAQESADLVQGTCQAELNACLEVARSGSWADLDEIPWLLVQGYVTTGKADPRTTRRVERMLAHGSSSIREWFHYVAWMIQPALDLEEVRPTLLQNLADKLGAVMESAGLLASLHPDKSVLDAEAEAFEPADGLEDQYRNRLSQIREQQWNSFKFNLLLAENDCRGLIWDSVKSIEVVA